MKANEIRNILKVEFIGNNLEESSKIWQELQICNGRSSVDLALLDKSLKAFEIKSDFDSLARLPSQIENYNKVFDYITIVTGESHLVKVMKLVPEFWGVWTIKEVDGKTIRTVIRNEKINVHKDTFSIAQLLWKEEILDLLKKNSLYKGMASKRKWLLWEFLSNKFTEAELSEEVKFYLRKRENWKIANQDIS